MSRSEPVSVMPDGLIESFRSGSLEVQVFRSRPEMAAAAAAAVAGEIRRLIGHQRRAVGIFAATPSIAEFYDRLVEAPGLEWTSVIGFHLGEHLGREESAPDSSRRFLIERLVKRVPLAEFHGVRGEAANPQAVCANYAALLRSRPPDWAVLEIGRDGSLAYLPPALCDFDDSEMVRLVEAELDGESRGALSLTIPAMMACRSLFALASGVERREAVVAMLNGEIVTGCPASILRTHPEARLFLDAQAASRLSAGNSDWGS